MLQVKKRNGAIVPFNKQKIIEAINKAFIDVDGQLYESDTANDIADEVKYAAKVKKGMVSVEEIQDMVEDFLMQSERRDVAKAYIRYRHLHALAREKYGKLMNAVQQKVLANDVQNSNANVDEYSFGGRKFEAAGIVMKQLADDTLLSEDVKRAKNENRIYIHDYDNYSTGMHNCSFVDFKRLFTEGFVTRNGDVRPPKSISTAMQQVAVVLQCQSQVQYGGVASAHIDFDLAPFVKLSFAKHYKDGLKYIEGIPSDDIDYEISYMLNNVKDYSIEDPEWKAYNAKAYQYAIDMTERETLQAAQGLYHNLNTLESRPGGSDCPLQ